MTERLPAGVERIDLDQALEGFRCFVSAWLVRRGGAVVVVDPGPRATLPRLLAALQERAVDRVDAVLLTHIHIDHAGGTGLLLERYPDARVVCHPKAIPHLVDPAKLWAGSCKVLGRVAEAYGEIAPVAADRIGFQDETQVGGLRVAAWDTPGHAPHHLCFQVEEVLFAGEVAGIRHPLPNGDYRRPATPPVFHYPVSQASLEAVARIPADWLCLGHYGAVRAPAVFLDEAGEQLTRWVETARRQRREDSRLWDEAVLADLRTHDPLFARFAELPADIQAREAYFTANSLKGIRGYLEAG